MKKTRRSGATETFSISVDPETKRALRALANKDFAGNLSALVTDLAEEARRPGVDLPRSVFGGTATVVSTSVLISIVAVAAFSDSQSELASRWVRAPLVGISLEIGDHLPHWLALLLRGYVGATGALILLVAVTTSFSGFARLAYSLGEHGQLPGAFGRLSRRARASPYAILSAALVSSAIVALTALFNRDVTFLASLFSFGVLLAFTAAQLAVIKLRVDEPDLPRPYRAPLSITIGRAEVPLPALVGAPLTFAIWVIAMATHPAARYAGPPRYDGAGPAPGGSGRVRHPHPHRGASWRVPPGPAARHPRSSLSSSAPS